MTSHTETILKLAHEYEAHKARKTERTSLARWGITAVRILDTQGSEVTPEEAEGYQWLKARLGKEIFDINGPVPPEPEWVAHALRPEEAPMKTVTIELVMRTQVPEDTDLQHLSVDYDKVRVPLKVGALKLDGTVVVGYETRVIASKDLTYQFRITEGDYTLPVEPRAMADAIAEAQEKSMTDLKEEKA